MAEVELEPCFQTIIGDTLLVFGEGELKLDIKIAATRYSTNCCGWAWKIDWKIEDPFADPESNGLEWSLCRPYMMTGGWHMRNGGVTYY